MKRVLLTWLAVSVSFISFTQTVNYQLPKILLPSPAAQNFLRYGEIPVDMNTGVPRISIPLYTVKSRKLQFPITASYHASGIKVGDRASVIGLGWVLGIKGNLAVTVLSGMRRFDTIGRPTYKTAQAFNDAKGIAGSDNSAAQIAFVDLMDLEGQSRDWQSERFSFQLPTGLSGTFRYDFITGELLKLPYGSYKVNRLFGTYTGITDTITNGFIITDDKGDMYSFGFPPGGNYQNDYQSMDLLNIISADKSDTIRFSYKSGSYNIYENTTFGAVIETGDDAYENSSCETGYNPTVTFSRLQSRVTTSERILDSIITATTIIKVVSAADRADMAWFQGKFRVTKLEVYDRFGGGLVNEVGFNHSYFGSQVNNNRRLRLDSIALKGNNSTTYNTYKFDYDTTIQLPRIPEDDSTLSTPYSEDYWGYYNNSSSMSKIPQEFVPDSFISTYTGFKMDIPSYHSTNRNPDHNYAKAALIKSLTYPTGGKTVFEFEPNYAVDAYSYPGETETAGYVGGFRVHQIKNYSDSGKLAETKTYKYSPGKTRTITSDLFVYPQRIYKDVYYGGSGCNGSWKTAPEHIIYTSYPLLPLSYDHGPPVFYEKVTEYIGDTIINAGKTEYTYLYPVSTVHASSDHPRFQHANEQDRGNYTPLLSTKVEYKNIEGQYVPARKTINNYTTYKNSYSPTGMHLVHTSSYPLGWGMETYSGQGSFEDTYYHSLGVVNYFHVFDLKATQAIDMLTKTEEILYGKDTTQQLLTTTIYKYDTITHLQPLELLSIGSKGDTIKTKFKYPIDYAGTAIYDSMSARNIISPVIEQLHYNNSNFLQSSKTNYYAWSTSFIAPQTVESKMLSNNSETRLRFIAYDAKGNTLSVSKENDIKMSYLWDYDNLYPIAEVANADTGQIAYSSFEADGKGNWAFSGAASLHPTAMTGKYGYSLAGGNVVKSGLSSGISYIVTYWKKDSTSTVTANSGSGTLITTKNGWKLYTHEITGTTSITISGTAYIDELRLYPKSAQMVTRTYTPLIGVTSESDATNKIIYYEYDDAYRLKLIKDDEGRILKRFDYKYKAAFQD
jgi:hypothetical protein